MLIILCHYNSTGIFFKEFSVKKALQMLNRITPIGIIKQFMVEMRIEKLPLLRDQETFQPGGIWFHHLLVIKLKAK